ncbi:hypothetical protein, partial [Desulfofundulus sp.]|uniref:hypothetical protein n=1 Tax=Desulfofundulus sp. TaxID=2282750 RepID=UPI003C77FF6E
NHNLDRQVYPTPDFKAWSSLVSSKDPNNAFISYAYRVARKPQGRECSPCPGLGGFFCAGLRTAKVCWPNSTTAQFPLSRSMTNILPLSLAQAVSGYFFCSRNQNPATKRGN